MPRQNTPHDHGTLIGLAEDFERAAKQIRGVAKEFAKAKIPERISVAHQSKMDDGLAAVRKFTRELSAKIEDYRRENA